jgi:adenylate cyclase
LTRYLFRRTYDGFVALNRPGATDFVAAGLYDPCAPTADQTLDFLEWLVAQGFSVDELRAATESGSLIALIGDSTRHADVHLSGVEVSIRSRISIEQLVEFQRASGLTSFPLDAPRYTEADTAAFELLLDASKLFSWAELMQFLRVVGSAMASVGSAANTLFLHDVEQPLRQAGASDLELATQGVESMRLARGITPVLGMLFRLHLDQAIVQSRLAQGDATELGLTVSMAVGFVDLVGFTPRSAAMTPRDLAELVSRFEAIAHDIVTDHGGRLVKFIGDEVMFVAVDAGTGCDIAVALLTTFGSDPVLAPRAGLAYGTVLTHGGDFFGPTVNLAARLAEQAVPGEALATPEVARSASAHHVEPAGRRMLKGFEQPVTVVSLSASSLAKS